MAKKLWSTLKICIFFANKLIKELATGRTGLKQMLNRTLPAILGTQRAIFKRQPKIIWALFQKVDGKQPLFNHTHLPPLHIYILKKKKG